MFRLFDIITAGRKNFVKLLDGLSIEQLNQIPENFNNNIAWNFGHIVVSQQNLCYVRAGLTPCMEEYFIEKYQKGTKPEGFISANEIAVLKENAFSLIEQLKTDMEADKFSGYTTFVTHFGVELTCIKDAVAFFAAHDTLHLGYAMAIARQVLTQNRFSNFQHIKSSN